MRKAVDENKRLQADLQQLRDENSRLKVCIPEPNSPTKLPANLSTRFIPAYSLVENDRESNNAKNHVLTGLPITHFLYK